MKRRRWFLLMIWLLSLAGISFYGGTISYGIFFAVTLLPLISFVYLYLVYLKFRIYQELGKRVNVCGEPASYHFVLQNDEWFAISGIRIKMFSSFSSVENMQEDEEFELLPQERYDCVTNMVCRYRGEYEVGVKEIILTDFFRIFQVKYRIPSALKAVVSPRVVLLEELKSLREIPLTAQREAFFLKEEPDTVVREYLPGDSKKYINWKATARSQNLMVRTMTGEENRGVVVFFDGKRYSDSMREYLPLENKILEVVLALAHYFATKNSRVSLCYGEEQFLLTRMQEFESFYQRMTAFSFEEGRSSELDLQEMQSRGVFADAQVVFFVLHEISEQTLAITEELNSREVIVIIYLVTEEPVDEYLKLHSERRKVIPITTEGKLEGVL